MKLKTKFQDEDFELGEVVDVAIATRPDGGFTLRGEAKAGGFITIHYKSLKELYDNWEDYEEKQLGYWYYDTTINNADFIDYRNVSDEDKEKDQAIGNYFETREEAEKVVEKLKAWQRLRDNGFKFGGWSGGGKMIKFKMSDDDILGKKIEDLDLLFGDEE